MKAVLVILAAALITAFIVIGIYRERRRPCKSAWLFRFLGTILVFSGFMKFITAGVALWPAYGLRVFLQGKDGLVLWICVGLAFLAIANLCDGMRDCDTKSKKE